MTTINLTKVTPPDQASVTITATQEGYSVEWAQQPIGQGVEIWQNTTNNRATATKVGTAYDTYFDMAPLTAGTTYYVWTRRVSALGTPSAWDYGTTAGQAVVPTGVSATSLSQVAGSSTSISISAAVGSTVPSSYNVWTDTGCYVTFTCPSGKGIVKGFMAIHVTASGASGGTFDSGEVLARIKVRNTTDSVDVPGMMEYVTLYSIRGTTITTYTAGTTFNIKNRYGFGDNPLIPGKSYRIDIQLYKGREDVGLTYSLTVDSSSTSSATSDSVSF